MQSQGSVLNNVLEKISSLVDIETKQSILKKNVSGIRKNGRYKKRRNDRSQEA